MGLRPRSAAGIEGIAYALAQRRELLWGGHGARRLALAGESGPGSVSSIVFHGSDQELEDFFVAACGGGRDRAV